MPHILMIFIDGIGLGEDNPAINPFASAHMPTLTALSGGRWLHDTAPHSSERAVFIPSDPRLGVPGRPQSGSNQAAILTGRNVPQLIGRHYGPKPDESTRAIIEEGNFFKELVHSGRRAALIEAYPPGFHRGISSGKSLPSSYQQAALSAGQQLFGLDELRSGQALSVDWTNQALSKHLKISDLPIYSPHEAGRIMVRISRSYDFAMHAHWLTDMVGHRGPLEDGVQLLELLDGVMAGVIDEWDDDEGLVILTSDHGNMEHIGDRRHTENPVPTLVIGRGRQAFAESFRALTDFVPLMRSFLPG